MIIAKFKDWKYINQELIEPLYEIRKKILRGEKFDSAQEALWILEKAKKIVFPLIGNKKTFSGLTTNEFPELLIDIDNKDISQSSFPHSINSNKYYTATETQKKTYFNEIAKLVGEAACIYFKIEKK